MTRLTVGLLLALCTLAVMPVWAQMVTGTAMPGYAQTFRLPAKPPTAYEAHVTACSAPGNVLWPGEQPKLSVQVINHGAAPLAATGKLDVIAYGTRGEPGDVWTPHVFKIADAASVPLKVSLTANGFQNLTVTPQIPARFGGYALIVDLGPAGRQFLTSVVRTFKATQGRVQYPQFCLDSLPVDVLKRLDVHAIRYGEGYKPTTDKDYSEWYAREGQKLKDYNAANIAVLFMVGGGEFFGPTQPLGRPRPWLDDKGVMQDTKFDLAWLPSYDADFQQWCYQFARDYGWPKGPINAFSLWNEPWEGISISGWGADMLRYRELYTRMFQGVNEARQSDGAQVLVGGCDSSSNAMDKLFCDGTKTFLPMFDFLSIHYQGLDSMATVKDWVDRKGYGGRVKIWDTESWVANTDDRVAAVVAGDRAAGYDRAMGVFGGNIVSGDNYWEKVKVFGADGKQTEINALTTWSTAAAVGASQHFIGERPFSRLLFSNGLPWVMLFHGLARRPPPRKEPSPPRPPSPASGRRGSQRERSTDPSFSVLPAPLRPLAGEGAGGVRAPSGAVAAEPDPDDGTAVVVGDLGEEFGADQLPYRTARGFAERRHKAQLRKQLGKPPSILNPVIVKQYADLQKQIDTPETLRSATMTLAADPAFHLYDFYGNAVPAKNGKIIVPLDGRGFFLRADGKPGSFARLTRALQAARIEGIEPVAVVAHDMTAPIDGHPTLRLSLTNVLNRPLKGTLAVTLGDLTVDAPPTVSLKGNETQDVVFRVTGGAANASNTYPLSVTFDGGANGKVTHREDIHCNIIAHKTITVDGNLDDWWGVLPQTVTAGAASQTLTEAAWFPFKAFDASIGVGFATGYLAYDDANFYFAAKVADSTPDTGMVRFATRNDDDYFYPEVSHVVRLKNPGTAPVRDTDTDTPQDVTWPAGVRRYSYRKEPELPSGNTPAHDNVQIAFNVLSQAEKPWYPHPPGVMFGFTHYKDTDYEYALNPVAPQYGGGTEIWRLAAPGMPHKHFYPRQPKSPQDGPVKDGKLVITRDGNTRIVECAIPWTEMPEVKKRLDARQPIKFSFRVNDDKGAGTMELSRNRSVAKRNNSFHSDWIEHWANEIEFGWEK